MTTHCAVCDDATPGQRYLDTSGRGAARVYCSPACHLLYANMGGATRFMRLRDAYYGVLASRTFQGTMLRTTVWAVWHALHETFIAYEALLTQEMPRDAGPSVRQVEQLLQRAGGHQLVAWALPQVLDENLTQAFAARRAHCDAWLASAVTQRAAFAYEERQWRQRRQLAEARRWLADRPVLTEAWVAADWSMGEWLHSKLGGVRWSRVARSLDKKEPEPLSDRQKQVEADVRGRLEVRVANKPYFEEARAQLDQLEQRLLGARADDDAFYCELKYALMMLYAHERVYLAMYLMRELKLSSTVNGKVVSKEAGDVKLLTDALAALYDALWRCALQALQRPQETVPAPVVNKQTLTNKLGSAFRLDLKTQAARDDEVREAEKKTLRAEKKAKKKEKRKSGEGKKKRGESETQSGEPVRTKKKRSKNNTNDDDALVPEVDLAPSVGDDAGDEAGAMLVLTDDAATERAERLRFLRAEFTDNRKLTEPQRHIVHQMIERLEKEGQ